MKPINRDISKAVRAIHRLSELIEALHAEGVRVEVRQFARWRDNGNTWTPGGFELTVSGETFSTTPTPESERC